MPLPRDTALVAILRGKRVVAPSPDDSLEAGDELVFVCTSEVEDDVRRVILGERPPTRRAVPPIVTAGRRECPSSAAAGSPRSAGSERR